MEANFSTLPREFLLFDNADKSAVPKTVFVKLRELLASNKELARRFDQLEARLEKRLTEHDDAIAAILSAIRQLMNPPTPHRGIGFTADLGKRL